MAKRVCAEHGCYEIVDTTRCPAHTKIKDTARGTTGERGYDYAHQRLRASWARKVAAGIVPCARCGERISPLEPWDLDHTDDRTAYLGPSCRACNRGSKGR